MKTPSSPSFHVKPVARVKLFLKKNDVNTLRGYTESCSLTPRVPHGALISFFSRDIFYSRGRFDRKGRTAFSLENVTQVFPWALMNH